MVGEFRIVFVGRVSWMGYREVWERARIFFCVFNQMEWSRRVVSLISRRFFTGLTLTFLTPDSVKYSKTC